MSMLIRFGGNQRRAPMKAAPTAPAAGPNNAVSADAARVQMSSSIRSSWRTLGPLLAVIAAVLRRSRALIPPGDHRFADAIDSD